MFSLKKATLPCLLICSFFFNCNPPIKPKKREQAMIAPETTPQAALVTPIVTPIIPKNVVRFMDAFDTSFSSNVDQIFRGNIKESIEIQGATLLLSVADIVSKEIDSEGIDWEDDMLDPPPLSLVETENLYSRSVPHTSDAEPESRPRNSFHFLSRIRAVSLDLCDEVPSRGCSPQLDCSTKSGVAIVSPLNSPISRRNPRRTSKIKAFMLNKRSEMPTRKSVEAKGTLTGPVKTILRKKFSWKNYPEVCCMFSSCEFVDVKTRI
jgi:hypothetical protein